MKRTTVIILLILLAFLQGMAGWDLFERHEVCAHGELVHASSDAKGESHGKDLHDHCTVFGCLGAAVPLPNVAAVSAPALPSQDVAVAPLVLHLPSIVLNEAPKTSPPRV